MVDRPKSAARQPLKVGIGAVFVDNDDDAHVDGRPIPIDSWPKDKAALSFGTRCASLAEEHRKGKGRRRDRPNDESVRDKLNISRLVALHLALKEFFSPSFHPFIVGKYAK
uniref:Uncharacterized protein n=1 Tax=Panagrellus redivivus TaxID=6233 RepID=A0A7E4URG5_PANRE